MAANGGAVMKWDEEQARLFIDMIKEGKERGETVEATLELVADRLGRSMSSVRNRWYSHLIHQYNSESVAPAVPENEVSENEVSENEAPSNEEEATDTSDAPSDAPPINADTSLSIEKSDKKHIAGEVVLQRAGVHVLHDEYAELPPGTAPALVSRADLANEPYIKVAVSPITKAQLDIMAEPELYDLMMNVMIKIQELSTKREDALTKSRRELHIARSEYEEVRVGYTSLLGVINTARELAVKESDKLLKPSFRMDSNGNLETIR